jgi:hypothetical protein
MKRIATRVLGVGNRNADGKSRQKILAKYARKGDPVLLKHLKFDEGDTNKIEVRLIDGEKSHRVGFLPGRVGGMLAKHLDADHEVKAVIAGLPQEEDNPNTGIHLHITY